MIEGARDGTSTLPSDHFGFEGTVAHRAALDAGGRVTLPIASFVVYTGGLKVLLDAGLGPRVVEWEPTPGGVVKLQGGGLPGSLLALGLRPDDIDVVLLSHLHGDHSGWIWQEGRPFFPNAMVRFGAGDWTTFVEEQAPGADSEGIRALAEMGRVELIERDGEVAPGITSLHTPGHTPGHQTFVVSSGRQRALFLGDALSCPLQIEEPELEALADMDRRLGIETRERLLREVEEGDYVSGPHFPDVRFGRMIAANGALHWD